MGNIMTIHTECSSHKIYIIYKHDGENNETNIECMTHTIVVNNGVLRVWLNGNTSPIFKKELDQDFEIEFKIEKKFMDFIHDIDLSDLCEALFIAFFILTLSTLVIFGIYNVVS